jgi:glycosyltransferase involved in cell wall biosynthesis
VRILWTIANWKRTGPVEPSLDLAAAAARAGHEVFAATGRPVGTAPDEAAAACAARGLARLDLGLRLGKHRSLLGDARDAARLAEHLRALRPDAVQATLRNDHRVARAAVRRTGLATPLLRLWFEDGAAPPSRGEAALLREAARVFAFGEGPRRALEAAGVEPARVVRLEPPLDVDRLRRVPSARDEVRARHGAVDGVPLFGVVARVQAHRRFELLWEAATRLVASDVAFRLVLVGRGTRFEEVAGRPVGASGLSTAVSFAGYLRGDRYVETLGALDAQVFLVPGSDPTCRALREGMALGVPSVATRRGLLPEIVDDGRTGLLVDETPEALASALARLARDPGERRRLGEAAARRADRYAPAAAIQRWDEAARAAVGPSR